MDGRPQSAAQGLTQGPWPSPKLLSLIALILRLSLGLSLLSQGLMGYFAPTRGAGSPLLNLPFTVQQIVPVAQISIGLALCLGFLTVVAALAAAALSIGLSSLLLFQSFVGIATMGRGAGWQGMMNYGYDPFLMSGFSTSLTVGHQVAVILLSNVQINRFSVDALVFRADEQPPASQPDPEVVEPEQLLEIN